MPIERFEKVFIWISLLLLEVFFVAVLVAAFFGGIQLPAPGGLVDPEQLANTPPFDQPGVRQVGDGQYEVVMIAQTWQFIPGEIRVPVGSTVTFRITSRDVLHGFLIPNTNANVMLVPGQVSEVTTRFDKPGEYRIICHEYCGIGHQTMFARIFVEPTASETQARAQEE
ncbi:MAG: cytochrome c oxidase subunit II [Ardenticatenia bacterium]|nr:cytochrome c oxidase subunit II [Ardenticatenia bacterium]